MNRILIVCLGLVFSLGGYAQTESDHVDQVDRPEKSRKMKNEHNQERMAALKVGHLTNELDLTQEEAQKFWPIYNKYDRQKRALRAEYKPGKKPSEMNEEESETFLKSSDELKDKTRALDNDRDNELSGFFPASKRLKLKSAEKSFHKKMMKTMKKKRKSKKGKKRKMNAE